MIKNVIFDFGKVLVDYDFNPMMESLFSDERERRVFKDMVCGREFIDRCDLGEESFQEIIDKTKEQYPQWSEQLQVFHDRQLDAITEEFPGMRRIIERLKESGYRVFGLTNWSNDVYSVIEKFSICRMLEGVIISSEERLIKPDPAIYRCLCERFGLKPEECLFTDDKAINVEGARSIGMQAVQFVDAIQFEKALPEYGIHTNRV